MTKIVDVIYITSNIMYGCKRFNQGLQIINATTKEWKQILLT